MVANLELRAAAKSTASELLTPLVDAVKSGQLKSSIDGTPISFSVNDASFRFLTSTGKLIIKKVVFSEYKSQTISTSVRYPFSRSE